MPVARRTIPSADDYASDTPADVQAEPTPDLAVDEGTPEDEESTPRHASTVQSGWKAAKKLKESGGDFAKDFRMTEEEQLVKFLEPEPFAVYEQHWIERIGKKSFTCIGEGCPLCIVGDKPRKMYGFNVAVIEGQDSVELKMLNAGTRLVDALMKANDSKKGPLPKAYWSLSRSGNKTIGWTSNVTPVAARDLGEDWEIEDEATLITQLGALVPYPPSIVQMPTKQSLREIAEELE